MSYVAFATNRFDEVTAFYRQQLGFAVIEQWDRVHGRGQRFDLGGGFRLEILDNARERHPVTLDCSARVHIVIEVPDIQVAWKQARVAALPPLNTSWGARLFQVQDPDGVPITYLEWIKSEDETA